MIQATKTFLGKHKTTLLRKILPNYRKQRGDEDEKNHWSRLFSSKESLFSDPDFKNRADHDRVLQPELAALLPSNVGAPRILDVGCGPLSTVGISFAGGRVDLDGADPLATDYVRMLASISVEANCKLTTCYGQELEGAFGTNVFDLVTSVNALDHSEDPIAVFRSMLAVCKVGGYVYLYHAQDEGLFERYRGMHQWNFRNESGRLIANDGKKSREFIEGSDNVVVFSERTIPAEPRPFLEWIFKKTR
jgi:SAM-dependent methyltransferase